MKDRSVHATVLLIVLIVTDILVWYEIFSAKSLSSGKLHFLDVGQGDASLLEFRGGAKILIDTGPDRSVVGGLESSMGKNQKYIDILLITHPELDHYGGAEEVLDRFAVGAIILNGRAPDDPPHAWQEFEKKIKETQVPVIVVGEGDTIYYGDEALYILSPRPEFLGSADVNDTGIVALASTSIRILFMADTGFSIEEYLMNRYGSFLRADVLKVGHHGSRFSSGEEFLSLVSPKVALIGVGGENRYGHPAGETLSRLLQEKISIFRTDLGGTVTIIPQEKNIQVFVEREGE